jgi:hypothetical protein
MTTRFASGMRLGGGIDTGRTVADRCFVVDSPQELVNCRTVTNWKANTQVKLNWSYPLPADFVVSGTFQNVPGINYTASYTATTAQIRPSLGRDLSGGTRTANVPLVAPQTLYEERLTQIDLRVAKNFRLGPKYRLQANLDAFNLFNSSTILDVNSTFGSTWRQPRAILDGRLVQVSAKLDF